MMTLNKHHPANININIINGNYNKIHLHNHISTQKPNDIVLQRNNKMIKNYNKMLNFTNLMNANSLNLSKEGIKIPGKGKNSYNLESKIPSVVSPINCRITNKDINMKNSPNINKAGMNLHRVKTNYSNFMNNSNFSQLLYGGGTQQKDLPVFQNNKKDFFIKQQNNSINLSYLNKSPSKQRNISSLYSPSNNNNTLLNCTTEYDQNNFISALVDPGSKTRNIKTEADDKSYKLESSTIFRKTLNNPLAAVNNRNMMYNNNNFLLASRETNIHQQAQTNKSNQKKTKSLGKNQSKQTLNEIRLMYSNIQNQLINAEQRLRFNELGIHKRNGINNYSSEKIDHMVKHPSTGKLNVIKNNYKKKNIPIPVRKNTQDNNTYLTTNGNSTNKSTIDNSSITTTSPTYAKKNINLQSDIKSKLYSNLKERINTVKKI
jgi:hypothetical protein